MDIWTRIDSNNWDRNLVLNVPASQGQVLCKIQGDSWPG